MDSSSSRREFEERRQAEIRLQIAALQAQLTNAEGVHVTPVSPKRKASECTPGLLAPASPSPKKRKLVHVTARGTDRPAVAASKPVHRPAVHSVSKPSRTPVPQAQKPVPSTVLQKLASTHARRSEQHDKALVARSTSFTDKAVSTTQPEDVDAPERDDRLALVENLSLGPAEHKPPFDDPHFEKLEPNSGIRLSSRAITHEDFQDYLRGRYYLSPSKLYSVVRLSPNKLGYDVPVCGDWLTIAVVAERRKIKYSQAPVGIGRDDKTHEDDENLDSGKRPQKDKEQPAKPYGKKYVSMKLIDFGCRMRTSAAGGQTVIRGDAALSLLLFEADGYDVIVKENGKKEKVYKGGSRGAFEKMSVLKEGAVVALLNPRILKPFQRSAEAPHPTDNILALTPESVSSIAVIGQARDLGMCTAVKRDGTTCGSWCDRRIADVCDWHIQRAVERKRAGRAEFSAGTSGMSTGPKRKHPAYDPQRQWGLKPADQDEGGNATYVVAGHVVSGRNDSKSLFVSENMGRDAQAKASRKTAGRDADRALQRLLENDRKGSKALVAAREFGRVKEGRGKEKQKAGKEKEGAKENESDEGETETKKPRKSAYSAELIKQLGFDPTGSDGKRAADPKLQSKVSSY
ncbi:hypothetical protein WOLCODRAFT_83678 [Wolfiporia cocos MD-104 SS10]|uniref:Zinc finger Mcm10/DnaG-type domain-containing protein n=1 Tax=Wolfiporia cocos (strain MD-104) TaxID=742152 RepID=A0A2H3J4D2_WOLCO|nr:hypothetical protein WOLCODRAFT_83678 [Wolfiporia cocos MD-104 SS10]